MKLTKNWTCYWKKSLKLTEHVEVRDQLGRLVKVPKSPKRIISLVPSQTELLFDLELDDQILGVTKFCIHPRQKVKTKQIVGGTKNFRFEVINELCPDLIIGNKEENYEKGIRELASSYPVWLSDIRSLEQSLEMVRSVGLLTGRKKQSLDLHDRIKKSISGFPDLGGASAMYMIWKGPYMAAGTDTFIHDILDRLNLRNAIKAERYPKLEVATISKLHPDYIFLSSEPYPFSNKHLEEFRSLCPESKILLVDGEIFSWYGSRLLKAADYFHQLGKVLSQP